MASLIEYINPEGLRLDGRRPREGRRLDCDIGILPHADGSAVLSQGNTKVIAAVFGPRSGEGGRQNSDRAVVKCDVRAAPFSQSIRRRVGRDDPRLQHMSRLIKTALDQTLVHTPLAKCQGFNSGGRLLLPLRATEYIEYISQVDVQIHVLQMDAGVAAVGLNAAMLAVAAAGIPVKDFLASSITVCIDDTALLDPNMQELGVNPPQLLLACLPNLGQVVVLEVEGGNMEEVMLSEMLELAQAGAIAVGTHLNEALMAHVKRLAHA